MGSLSNAVQWWEEWQLRILVLGSLGIQCYISFFAVARKKHIRPLFRFSIWLAYLGADALAVYALATLFNRQRKLRHTSTDGSHSLEVLWAPILLIHLGGQINISAYNMEDNELWTRHVVTAVSQVAVALYVFCKSWSSLVDRRLLDAAILLFILGVSKCLEKPLVLKRNSFNSLVSAFHPFPRDKNTNREVELEEYIQEARDFVNCTEHPPTMDSNEKSSHLNLLSTADKLFVDSAYAYTYRLDKLKSFWLIDNEGFYIALRTGISKTFDLIYSKEPQETDSQNRVENINIDGPSAFLVLLNITLPIVPIILFHTSHKGTFRSSDIKVTFSLSYITYLLEISSILTLVYYKEEWNDAVAQHSLIGFLTRNRRHRWLTAAVGSKPCYSSEEVTDLVQGHVRNGWINYITDTESYWKFSDIRGHWTLKRNRCEESLGDSIEKPFDESIILWHVATYFCSYNKGASPDSIPARLCREISNYMIHLLFSNREMLIPGSRRTLFTDAYKELKAIMTDEEDLSVFDEKQLTEKIIDKIGSSEEGIVYDSWVLAEKLMELGEDKMWELTKGVWIEMLCFSAGRCRGYLHAKSLGSGGEYLTFVSLLMSHAGLETFADRQQRVQLRLSKEERLEIANQRIQAARRKKSIGDRSTDEGVASAPSIQIVISPFSP